MKLPARIRVAAAAFAELLELRQPSGLITTAYIGAKDDERIATHRQLLRAAHPTQPRIRAMALVAWRWLGWILIVGPRRAANVAHRADQFTTNTAAFDLRNSTKELRTAALVHGIDPYQYHRFGLLHQDRRSSRFAYVYECEVGAWHHLRSTGTKADSGRRLLSDKHAFAEACAAASLPYAKTEFLVPKGATAQTLHELEMRVGQHWLAKPRHGSKATGVFVFRHEDHGIVAETLVGRSISDPAGTIGEHFASSEYIIQRLLPTHPDLRHLGAADQRAAVVRVITDRSEGAPRLWCAYSELPLEIDGLFGHATITVDAGGIHRREIAGQPQTHTDVAARSLATSATGTSVPSWADVLTITKRAHDLVPGLVSVAWDIVPTPTGPVLLEGNSGWSLHVPQLINGPMLDHFDLDPTAERRNR